MYSKLTVMKNLSLLVILSFNVLFASAQINLEDNTEQFTDAVNIENYINVDLYPNPNKGYFFIKMNNNTQYDVTIYAMDGMIVYNQKNIQESKYRIDLENSISKGFYQIAFRQGKNAIVKKLIIQ